MQYVNMPYFCRPSQDADQFLEELCVPFVQFWRSIKFGVEAPIIGVVALEGTFHGLPLMLPSTLAMAALT